MQPVLRVALFGAALGVAGTIGYFAYQPRARATTKAAQSLPRPAALPSGTLLDPIVPSRPVALDRTPRADAGSNWISARPGFQYSHTPRERGGIEPCATQPVDTSAFEDWAPLSKGEFITPRALTLDASGRFDVIIHLHGNEPIRRELVQSGQRFVLWAITLGAGQGYTSLFSSSGMLAAMTTELQEAVSKRIGKPAQVGRVALSAWSAGFTGVQAALAQHRGDDVDAVILIDGLHAPRGDRDVFKAQLQPFVDYAKRALSGERFFYVSHSSIDPAAFASTTECAHYLLHAIGGEPQPVQRTDALGLELVEYFSRGQLHVRGYAGNDKSDHCAQIGVLRDVYAALGRRWTTASGTRTP